MKIEDIKDYKEILTIINKNKNSIQRNYNLKDDQILIEKSLINKILIVLNKPYYQKSDKVQLVKIIIKDILKLKDNDLIMVKQGSIFVKIFDETKRRKISKKELNTEASRYNGIPEEDLESFYNEYFTQEDLEYLFDTISNIFVKKYFLKGHINNTEYEKNVFGIIQKLILKELQNDFDCDEDFYIGFSGYIFRKHFKTTFEYISDYILKEAAKSNKYILNFLDYYSNNIIVFEGRKYQVPNLEAENGLRWHVLSMVARIKPYIMAQEYILDANLSIENLEDEIKNLYIDGISPVDYNEKNIEIAKEIKEEIEECNEDSEKIHDLLHTIKNKDGMDNKKADLEKELIEIKEEKKELKEELAAVRKEIIEKTTIKQYEKLIQEKKVLKNNIYVRSKVIKQSRESYVSIRNSLTKALMSKKQLLKAEA